MMEKTLKVINSLVEKVIIRGYAIGGGVAATFYGESTLTYDLDLFVYFPTESDDLLILTPIFQYLKKLGYKVEGEGIRIEGVLVQFLPCGNPLIREAVDGAKTVPYNNIETRIVSPEHLIAIMVQTFRPKDKLRLENLLQLMNDPKAKFRMDKSKLLDILKRHGLKERWNDFIREK